MDNTEGKDTLPALEISLPFFLHRFKKSGQLAVCNLRVSYVEYEWSALDEG